MTAKLLGLPPVQAMDKSEKERLKKLLSDAIPLLCKNGLPCQNGFRIEAMIGITVGESDVVLICFKETVTSDGELITQRYGSDSEELIHETAGGDGDVVNIENDEEYGNFPIEKEEDNKFDTFQNTPVKIKADPDGSNFTTPSRKKCPKRQFSSFVSREPVQVKEEALSGNEEYYDEQNSEEYNSSYHSAQYWNQAEDAEIPFKKWKKSDESQTWDRTPQARQQRTPKSNSSSAQAPKRMPRGNITASISVATSQPKGSGYNNIIQGLCDSIINQSGMYGEQFTCHICQAKLSNATTLRNHIRGTHLALKTERCNICGESFKWAMQLARHKKRAHGDGSFINIYNANGMTEETVNYQEF